LPKLDVKKCVIIKYGKMHFHDFQIFPATSLVYISFKLYKGFSKFIKEKLIFSYFDFSILKQFSDAFRKGENYLFPPTPSMIGNQPVNFKKIEIYTL
jgi:hypothetical protein